MWKDKYTAIPLDLSRLQDAYNCFSPQAKPHRFSEMTSGL